MDYTAHRDTFVRDNLPPSECWPELVGVDGANLSYATRTNCATELLDGMVARGFGDKTLFFTHTDALSPPGPLRGLWTYAHLLERANQIAHVLCSDFGLVPGNRVLLRGANSPLLAAIWFAVLKAGGICVTTMPLLRQRELSYMLDKADIHLALCEITVVEELESAQGECPALRTICVYGEGANKSSHPILEQLMQAKPKAFDNIETAADDAALMAFTSGTTGKAKGTVHFHRDVLTICDCFPPQILKPESSDIFCGTPHFAFTFGLGGLLLFPMRIGASVVLLPKSSPEEVVAAIDKFKATICFSSPTGYRAMSQFVRQYDVSSLRKCVSAGETLPLATFSAWQDATGIKLIDGIGATEMLHIFISAKEEEIRPGSTGKPIPPYQAKIVTHSGQSCPPNTVGLLAVRGPTGCRYFSDLERQKEYVKDGWNITGDAYSMDSDGYFWFHARADDMIISSGYNISGHEVENTLLAHPKVRECAVISAPDTERGNVVKAVIVLHSKDDNREGTVKELQDFVKSQIAPYKYPRRIEFVESLPRTETGKLQRYKLREQASVTP